MWSIKIEQSWARLLSREDSANYNDRPPVQSLEVHERRGCINGKWNRWKAKDGRNLWALTQKEGEEGSFPQSKEWQRKYAGSYKIVKYSRKGTCYLESLNGKQLPHPWRVEHFKRYYRKFDEVFNFLSSNLFLSRNE